MAAAATQWREGGWTALRWERSPGKDPRGGRLGPAEESAQFVSVKSMGPSCAVLVSGRDLPRIVKLQSQDSYESYHADISMRGRYMGGASFRSFCPIGGIRCAHSVHGFGGSKCIGSAMKLAVHLLPVLWTRPGLPARLRRCHSGWHALRGPSRRAWGRPISFPSCR